MWLAYGVFAIATILLGALLGLIFVCVADFIFPPKELKRKSFSKDETNEDDLVKDEIEGGDDDEAELLANDDEIISSNDEDNDEENLTESDRAPGKDYQPNLFYNKENNHFFLYSQAHQIKMKSENENPEKNSACQILKYNTTNIAIFIYYLCYKIRFR